MGDGPTFLVRQRDVEFGFHAKDKDKVYQMLEGSVERDNKIVN